MNRIINYLFDVVRGVLFYFSQTKLRTALTLLGITVGVSSIIAIMTVLATFEKSTEQVVAEVRTNVFYITRENPIEVSFGNNNKWTRNKPKITWSEYEQLKRSLKLIKNMSAVVSEEPSDRTFSVGKKEFKSRLQSFWAADGDMLSLYKYDIVDGRNIQNVDIQNRSRVAIIGSAIKDELFPYANPVGKEIKIDNIPFEIIALTDEKGEVVQVSYESDQIIEIICRDFNFFKSFKRRPFIKKSLWSNLLNYMGFAGYLNPFTLESNINLNIPKLNFIVTAAHEIAHQAGFASESEANFIAFISSLKNSDPYIKYAGLTFALSYCYSELLKTDPVTAKKYMSLLNPGILESYKEISRFWNQYKNPLEPIIKKSYDSYLKANGQSMGIESYDGMVGLVVGYLKKNNLIKYKFD